VEIDRRGVGTIQLQFTNQTGSALLQRAEVQKPSLPVSFCTLDDRPEKHVRTEYDDRSLVNHCVFVDREEKPRWVAGEVRHFNCRSGDSGVNRLDCCSKDFRHLMSYDCSVSETRCQVLELDCAGLYGTALVTLCWNDGQTLQVAQAMMSELQICAACSSGYHC
jgi:hypothetical protein